MLFVTAIGKTNQANDNTATASADSATATATFQANDNTATAASADSATATITSANPDPYGNAGGTLALFDPLSRPGKWDNQSVTSFGGSCQFMHAGYHIVESHSNSFYPCVDTSSSFDNFVFEVKMTINQGDCGGMELRADLVSALGYTYFVCSDGTYQFDLYTSGANATTLISGNNSGTTSGQNSIAVVASGSNFTLYLNNTKLNSVSDSSYSQGDIGLIAADTTKTTGVTYSNTRVWTL